MAFSEEEYEDCKTKYGLIYHMFLKYDRYINMFKKKSGMDNISLEALVSYCRNLLHLEKLIKVNDFNLNYYTLLSISNKKRSDFNDKIVHYSQLKVSLEHFFNEREKEFNYLIDEYDKKDIFKKLTNHEVYLQMINSFKT